MIFLAIDVSDTDPAYQTFFQKNNNVKGHQYTCHFSVFWLLIHMLDTQLKSATFHLLSSS